VVTIAHSTSMRLASTKRRQRIADFSTVFMLNLTRQLQNRHAAFKSSNIRIRSCSEAEVKSGAGGGESRRQDWRRDLGGNWRRDASGVELGGGLFPEFQQDCKLLLCPL
jgi:hypothetical protein